MKKMVRQLLDPKFVTHILMRPKQMHIVYIGKHGKICAAGRYMYRHATLCLVDRDLVKELVEQTNSYMQGKRRTIPSAHCVDGVFQVV